jgi:hypothetical protein
MTPPKLPEPDGYYYPESPSFSKPVPSFWFETSVRAIQEAAYRAGMAAAKEIADGLHKQTGGLSDFDNGWASAALQISQAISMLAKQEVK